MNSFGSFILRILLGDRLRKAGPSEHRSGAATLFIVALGIEVFFLAQKYSPGTVENVMGNAAELWIAWVVMLLIGLIGSYLLWKYLSMKVLVMLAALMWVVTFVTLFWFGIFGGNLP